MNLNATAETGEQVVKRRVGAVSYLNTKPLIYGFENGLMKDEIELLIDYPSRIAELLLQDKIDIGLVPVAVIPSMKEHYIVGDFCIAADGPVASVCLFSEVPLDKIRTILLDYQSRTSVLLVQFLVKEYWKINPVFEDAGTGFIDRVKGSTAAVIIGDRAFHQRTVSAYCYDLGEAWKACTGLPFVFAAWVSNKPVPAKFVADFNRANQFGLDHLTEVIKANPFDEFDLEAYYRHYIQFRLDAAKRAGLQRFLTWCSKYSLRQLPV